MQNPNQAFTKKPQKPFTFFLKNLKHTAGNLEEDSIDSTASIITIKAQRLFWDHWIAAGVKETVD